MQNVNKLPLDLSELEKSLGYSFINKDLLAVATTHSSYVNEARAKGEEVQCNERLEFLGDSVLSIIVSRYLFAEYKDVQEGDLTKIRASVVCEKALAKYAGKINLGSYLKLGKGEDLNHGRERPSIIADAFEAVLGAFYIDTKFDSEPVSRFLLPFVKNEIDFIRSSSSFVDYKTALQQIVQQAYGEKLEYVLVKETGPDHSKTFTVEARLNSNVIGMGEGASKRVAEQMAAKKALEIFGDVTKED
ncbi:MAG: ribonuclease III [Clostridia bacterium]|nr:ribonuclease III [Clostridia bacterium]